MSFIEDKVQTEFPSQKRFAMINILFAQESDADEIRKLLCRVWADTFQNVLPEKIVREIPQAAYDYHFLKAQLQDSSMKFILAKNADNNIVGVINAKQDQKVIYINRLYIDRNFQRQGLGARLIAEIINCFPSAEKIILEVIEKNTPAVRFYLKNGFTVAKRDTSEIGGNRLDVLVLQKEIPSNFL